MKLKKYEKVKQNTKRQKHNANLFEKLSDIFIYTGLNYCKKNVLKKMNDRISNTRIKNKSKTYNVTD